MKIVKVDISNDKTKKYFFKTADPITTHIEACLLKLMSHGYIICVSSQVGCTQACKFCAATKSKFTRNLSCSEIVEQVQLIVNDNPQLLDKGFEVTYMGSGEPLCNYTNVFNSIDFMKEEYPALSKVNISTTCPTTSENCFKQIDWYKYKDFLHFQYSLHFTNNSDRYNFLWPELLPIEAAIHYLNKISTFINDTYKVNYIPFSKINDSKKHVDDLKTIMDSTQGAVLKISRMCEIIGSSLMPSECFDDFVACAKKEIDGLEVFYSDGTDVNAGCGQFYNDSIV